MWHNDGERERERIFYWQRCVKATVCVQLEREIESNGSKSATIYWYIKIEEVKVLTVKPNSN